MIGVVLAVEPQHPRDLRFGGPPPGRLAEPPVAQALRTLLMQPVAPAPQRTLAHPQHLRRLGLAQRSEEHTSELQSLMRISYAVFCLKKKKNRTITLNKNQ